LWNAEKTMVDELNGQRFSAVVGYGFPDAPAPKSMLVVVRGVVERAGGYDGRELDWDLRAAPMDWLAWLNRGFDLSNLLVAVGSGRLQVRKGDAAVCKFAKATTNAFSANRRWWLRYCGLSR